MPQLRHGERTAHATPAKTDDDKDDDDKDDDMAALQAAPASKAEQALQAVERLADYVPQLEPVEQKRLYKWLKKSYRDQAPRLWQALESALGKSDSRKAGLRGLLFGSKEK